MSNRNRIDEEGTQVDDAASDGLGESDGSV
jgi:hypothetical protein